MDFSRVDKLFSNHQSHLNHGRLPEHEYICHRIADRKYLRHELSRVYRATVLNCYREILSPVLRNLPKYSRNLFVPFHV